MTIDASASAFSERFAALFSRRSYGDWRSAVDE
jgi:hypothetical protein